MLPNFKEVTGIDTGKDLTRGFVNLLGMYIPTQDSLLLQKSGGSISLYKQTAQDDRVFSCYQQRFSGLTSKKFKVVPGGDKPIDKKAAEDLEKQLKKLNWDDITEKMLWGVHYGYSIAEIIWARDGNRVIILEIKVRERERFRFGIDLLPKLLSFEHPMGEDLPPQKFWHFCTGADHHDEPYGRGLGYWLYWLAFFKRTDLKWWMLFLENFADPTKIVSYEKSATPEEKATAKAAGQAAGKDKVIVKPIDMIIEYLEAGRSGAADYSAMYDSCNTAISTVILSQNMTSESGSSLSQAQVHQDVGDSVIQSDDALISESFNRTVATWITEWNYPGAAIPQIQRELEAPPDLKTLADTQKIVVDMGFPLDPDYVVATYGDGFKQIESASTPVTLNGAQLAAFVQLITSAQQAGWSEDMVKTSLQISFPHVQDELLNKMAESMKSAPPPPADPNAPQPPPPTPPGGQAAPRQAMPTPAQAAKELDKADSQFSQPEPDRIDNYVAQLTDVDSFRPWLEQAQELLMQSSDLNEYSDRLDELYPDLPSAEFTKAMKLALTATSMGGYFDAQNDGGDDETEFAMSDEEVEFKIAPGTIKERNGKQYMLVNSRWKSVHKIANPKKTKAKPLPVAEPLKPKYDSGFVGEIPSELIHSDPKRFQYKLLGQHTKTGEVGSLSGIKNYDPNLAGIVQVWKDPADNKLYIVNGHNRLALANRAGAEKVTARIVEAPDAATARGIGALTNIAEGRGTPLDAAKFFRDSGLTQKDLASKNLPIREKIATDGMAIATLEPHLFDKVVTGELTQSRAAMLGKTGLTGSQQTDLYDLAESKIKKGGKLTDDAFEELAEAAKASSRTSGTTMSLFGETESEKSNALERAALASSIKLKLSQDKKLFGLVSKSKTAESLSRAGNQIDTKESGKMANEATAAIDVFDKLKHSTGDVGSMLSKYASQVSDGHMTQAKAHTEAYKEITDFIKKTYSKYNG